MVLGRMRRALTGGIRFVQGHGSQHDGLQGGEEASEVTLVGPQSLQLVLRLVG